MVVATEIIWSAKLKIFTGWPLWGKFAGPTVDSKGREWDWNEDLGVP